MIDILISAAKAAEQFSLSENALAKMRHAGDGPPFIKVGRRVRYRASDVEEWLGRNRYRSTAELTAALAERALRP